jgi:hypothetical protein
MSTTTQERLEAAVKNLQTYADEVDATGAAPSGEQLGELKSRMEEVKNLKNQVKAEGEARGEIADAQAFLKSLSGTEEKKPERDSITLSGLPTETQGKTFGELFVGSPAYKDFLGRYKNSAGIIPNSVKGLQSGPFQATDLKALLTGASSTSAGAMVVNDRYPGITDLVGDRELTIRDLVTIGSTQSDTVEYVQVTGKTNNAAPVAEATSSAAPTVTVDGNAQSGVALVPNAGGGYKPESSMALAVVTETVKTIAHWMPLTKRAASDAAQVRTLIDNFLRYGLNEELEDQMLNGSGSGENFTGIMDDGRSIQTTGSAGTDIDAIVDAIRKIRVTGRRRPTALVIHPNDWYSTGFLLAKDSENRYLVGDPRASVEQLNQLSGLQVVVSEAITENTALVGDFRQAVLWEREGISLTMSDQHADFFTRNLLAVLAEFRAAFGVLDEEAFCSVTSV